MTSLPLVISTRSIQNNLASSISCLTKKLYCTLLFVSMHPSRQLKESQSKSPCIIPKAYVKSCAVEQLLATIHRNEALSLVFSKLSEEKTIYEKPSPMLTDSRGPIPSFCIDSQGVNGY